MILRSFTQADIGAVPSSILTESNGKGLYLLLVNVSTTPGVGAAGSVEVRLTWVDADGKFHALGMVLSVETASADDISQVINIGAGTPLQVQLEDAGGATGSFAVAVETYAARQNSQGND